MYIYIKKYLTYEKYAYDIVLLVRLEANIGIYYIFMYGRLINGSIISSCTIKSICNHSGCSNL